MGGVFQPAKQSSGGVVSSNFNALKALVASNGLIPEQTYSFSFQTKYNQPFTNTIKTGTAETLFITASSANTFERVVYSASFPEDIIHFDFMNQLCEDGTTARNGKIDFRHDTINNNSTWYDFRAVKFVRYTISLSLFDDWITTNAYVPGNFVKQGGNLYRCRYAHTSTALFVSDLSSFKWENITHIVGQKLWNTTDSFLGGVGLADVVTATEYYTFGADVKNCKVGKNRTNPYNNIVFITNALLGRACYDITIGNDCSNGTIDTTQSLYPVYETTIEDNVNNFILDCSYGNTIEKGSYGLFIGMESAYNTIKKYSRGTFISWGCKSNVIGEQNINSYLFTYSHDNNIGQNSQYVYINFYSKDNNIGTTCTNIVIFNGSMNNVGRQNSSNIFNYGIMNSTGENCYSIQNLNSTPAYGQMTGNSFSNNVGNIQINGQMRFTSFEPNANNITIGSTYVVSDSKFLSVSNKIINANWAGVNFLLWDGNNKTYTTNIAHKTINAMDENSDVYYQDIDSVTGAITTTKLL